MDQYSEYKGSRLWALLSDGMVNLVSNNDLEKPISGDHIVGYLCKLLLENAYFVDLAPDESMCEPFEMEDDNIARVSVYDVSGHSYTAPLKNITKKSQVLIALTKNGMLGLGTELIRSAMKYDRFNHTHIDPAMKEHISQNMGIVLDPESCDLITNQWY